MTFVTRHLKFKFQLGEGAFGEAGTDTVEFTGLRASVSVKKVGGNTFAEAAARIYGMPLDIMNRLSLLGKPLTSVRANTLTIYAYDDKTTPAVIFTGLINEAWIDATNAPEVLFSVAALDGSLYAVKPAAGGSYNGAVDLADIAHSIATQMGCAFENNSGVSVIVKDHHLSGTLVTQLQDVAQAGNFNCMIDQGTVAIWPAGGNRGGDLVEVSAMTGLVGYPRISDAAVDLQTLFNPLVRVGGKIHLQSIFTLINGTWIIASVVHDLESEMPGGKWFTELTTRNSVAGDFVADKTA